MAIEQYLGPVEPILNALSKRIYEILSSILSTPPNEEQLTRILIYTILSIIVTSIASFILSKITSSALTKDKRDIVLITGISGDDDTPAVGKTTLFKALKYGKQPKYGTTTSMKINEDQFIPVGYEDDMKEKIHWVDFPGHARLKYQYNQYVNRAKCILFLIDSQRFTSQARKDAQLLFDVLTNSVVSRKETAIAIVLNKQDEIENENTQLSHKVVKERLEAELERIRKANENTLRSATVLDNDINDSGDNNNNTSNEDERIPLGYDNEIFSFDHISSPIVFYDASAKAATNLQQIVHFVNEHYFT